MRRIGKKKKKKEKTPQFICVKELYYNVSTIKKRKKGRKGKKENGIYKAMFAFVRFIISPSDRPTTTYNILSAECDNKSRN